MFIKNEGEVPFDYRITYKTDKLRYLSLTNAIDSVNKGESKKILIEVIPGVPDKLDDEIIVEIAHFEPHHIKIKAVGYPFNSDFLFAITSGAKDLQVAIK